MESGKSIAKENDQGHAIELYTERGGEKAQQVWRGIIDKPIKMNAEVANPCFAVIRPLQSGSGLS